MSQGSSASFVRSATDFETFFAWYSLIATGTFASGPSSIIA
jgi:hypothetical protein